MKTQLLVDESMVKSGLANLQKGIETVGGKLYLTNRRLIFEAHALNIQGGNTLIDLTIIDSLELKWTKFLGLFPLFPNSLAVICKDGQEFWFVLYGRTTWKSIIENEINKQL